MRPQRTTQLRNSSSGWSSWKADCSNSPGHAHDRVLLARSEFQRVFSMSTLDVMTSLAWLFVGLVVVPTTIWIALAVHCHVRRPWLRWFVSVFHWPLWAQAWECCRSCPGLSIWLALLVITIAWWFSLRPKIGR